MRDSDICKEKLGHTGRMISFSKSEYYARFPDNLVVFNANLCLNEEKVWFGDIDVTIDRERLKQIAAETGKTLRVLREMDGRFGLEERPNLSSAVYTVTPEGEENEKR